MSPPTNSSLISLAFPPMSAEALLFPFDNFPAFSADDFLPPPPADQPFLFLPSASSAAADDNPSRELATVAPSLEVTVASPPPPPPAPLGTGQRTSSYRGVTRHRWTGRYEAHLWDNTSRREGQKRKGRQVYLGGYDKEEKAARAYDLAALKYWGLSATTNFPKENYIREIEEMQKMSKQELVASLRRKSSGFSRGASIYRGVTRHHQHGRWQARIGRVAGNKDLYLGTFATEEEAAEAYDVAALKFRGVNAVTNFEHSRYNLEAIAGSDLPINGSVRRQSNPVPETEGQITLVTSPFSQQSNDNNNSIPPYVLHNLLQLQSSEPSQPQPFYGLGEANFYWPGGNGQQKMELDDKIDLAGGLLQLANSAAN